MLWQQRTSPNLTCPFLKTIHGPPCYSMLTDQHREAEDSLGESADGRWQKRLTNWSEFVLEQHSTQWFRQQRDIHIQRQLSPRPGKRAGQLSSSTTIHYKWIKGKETMKTDWFADSRLTDKHRSSTEVHLLLNNRLCGVFVQITVWQTSQSKYPVLDLCVWCHGNLATGQTHLEHQVRYIHLYILYIE